MLIDDHFQATGGRFSNIGFTGWSTPPTTTPLAIGVWGLGATTGVFGLIDDGSSLPTTAIPPADSYAGKAGVLGAGNTDTGVAGIGNGIGVFGQSGRPPGLSTGRNCGVLGASLSAAGVVGESSIGTGVLGITGQNPPTPAGVAGVIGASRRGVGMFGVSTLGTGVLGTTGQNPPMVPNAGNAGVVGVGGQDVGVFGVSDSDVGVLGFSSRGVGVLGEADAEQGVGVLAFANGPNGTGVRAQAIAPGAKAGDFRGDVEISRSLTVRRTVTVGDSVTVGDTVTGTGSVTVGDTVTAKVKNAIVRFPDGTTRVLHCMESPEHWFEDFGTARLKRGRAVVKLDADFAKTIKVDDYHVFLTPEDDCGGLYIRNKRSASFEVRELQSGRSSVAFSYRIVGRRKDIRKHRRFAKFISEPLALAPETRTRSPVHALLTKVRKQVAAKPARALRKQAAAKPGRAGRRNTARFTQRLSTLLTRVRKQAHANSARTRKRAKRA